MPYIIDGHNLIGKIPSIDLSDPDDEAQLIQRLTEFINTQDKRAIVFFDQASFGGEREVQSGRLNVRFVRPPRSADEAIQSYIEKIRPQAINYVVVSSDRQVIEVAKDAGARWMTSESFASALSASDESGATEDKPQRPLSPDEIEDWERIFRSHKEDKSNL